MKSEILAACVLLCAAYFGSCNAQNETCSPYELTAPPLEFLNFFQLLNKTWFVQEVYARRPEDIPDPSTLDCYLQYMGFFSYPFWDYNEIYTNVSSGVRNQTEMVGVRAEWGDSNAAWTLGQITSPQYTVIFTHTDYDTYGVMYWCPYVKAAEHKYERVLTFTGAPVPDPLLLSNLRGLVQSIGFPTENVARIRHHTDCNYDHE